MINLIFGFVLTLNAYAVVSLAIPKYPVMTVADRLDPKVDTIYFSSSLERYTSFTQFYIVDHASIGRFCRIDDNGTPYDCIAIRPNLANNTCSIEPYKQAQKIELPSTHYDYGHCQRILTDEKFDRLFIEKQRFDEARETIRVCKGIRQAHVEKPGSAREIGLPQSPQNIVKFSGAKMPFVASRTAVEQTVREGQAACNRFFGPDGIQQRLEMIETPAGAGSGGSPNQGAAQ